MKCHVTDILFPKCSKNAGEFSICIYPYVCAYVLVLLLSDNNIFLILNFVQIFEYLMHFRKIVKGN